MIDSFDTFPFTILVLFCSVGQLFLCYKEQQLQPFTLNSVNNFFQAPNPKPIEAIIDRAQFCRTFTPVYFARNIF